MFPLSWEDLTILISFLTLYVFLSQPCNKLRTFFSHKNLLLDVFMASCSMYSIPVY